MSNRVQSRSRCDRCRLREVLCICAEIPTLAIRGRVTILMHWREEKLSSNTAKLVALAVPRCEIRVRGAKDLPVQTDDLESADTRTLLLFPSPDSVELSAELLQTDPRPVHLIVPDGSWNQAKKVANREPHLRRLTRVRLPPGPPSKYFLREAPHPESLSTLEAIARALGITEGHPVQAQLETIFELMVERTLWSRGKLAASECKTPIPQAAFDAFFSDGCRG